MKLLMISLSKFKQKTVIQNVYSSFASKSDNYWLGVLALFVIVSRWVGHMNYLYLSDSVRYALALDKYDVSLQQPHPPGYGLYILFTKPIYWLTGDANTALIITSIIFSVLAIIAVFYLAKLIYGRRVAWISVLILATAPLVWFHGQVALNYITDVFFSALTGIYIYKSLKNNRDNVSLIKASITLAIGGGFRPTLVIFMLPLWLWIILRRRNIKTFIINTGIVLGISLAWLVPAAYLSGGLISFWNAIYSLIFSNSALASFASIVKGTNQITNQLSMIARNLTFNFGLALVFVVLYLISFAVPKIEDVKININNLMFWSLWIFPAVLFYLFVIFTLSGYLLIIIPALTIIIAKSIDLIVDFFVKTFSKSKSEKLLFQIKLLSVIVIFIVSSNVFLYLNPNLSPPLEIQKSAHTSINTMNKLWKELIPTVKKEFNPQSTIVGINRPYLTWGQQHWQYYFPEYTTYSQIVWGIYNPDNKYWFMSYDGQIKLVDTLKIYPTDTKMIIVGPNWSVTDKNMKEAELPNELGKILYYDLTDLEIKKLLQKVDNIELVGVRDENAKTEN